MDATTRPLRADAARNRTRVLDAARTAFAEAGLDVGVEEIARRAGVGKGTLYRRFPTKEALVRAIFDDILEEVEAISVKTDEEPDPRKAFAQYLSEAAHMTASNQGFYDVVARGLGAAALSPEQRQRILKAAERPLKRAQEAGRFATTSSPRTSRSCSGCSARPPGRRPDGHPMDDHWPRYLGLLLDSTSPDAATELPAEAWRITT